MIQSETGVEARGLSLYEIEDGLLAVMDAREDAETPEEIAAADAAIGAYVEAEIRKVDGIRGYLRQCEVMIDAAKREAATQNARASAWEARRDHLKARCVEIMQAIGKPRLEGRTGKLTVTPNGGPLPVIVANESLVPDEYRRVMVILPLSQWNAIAAEAPMIAASLDVKSDISKSEIQRALLAGVGVPGAHLGERGVHLRVK